MSIPPITMSSRGTTAQAVLSASRNCSLMSPYWNVVMRREVARDRATWCRACTSSCHTPWTIVLLTLSQINVRLGYGDVQ